MGKDLLIKTALISVSDKKNLEILVNCFIEYGIEIIATGGTYQRIKIFNTNVALKEVSEITKKPEILEGRVKTLDYLLLASILFKRDNQQHVDDVRKAGGISIDLVIVDLYKFAEILEANPDDEELIVENIDIGGITLIRAAAKNFKNVLVLTSPNDYIDFVNEMKSNNGSVSYDYRLRSARKAFFVSAEYDRKIFDWFRAVTEGDRKPANYLPDNINLELSLQESLPYGENPHQSAAIYTSEASGMGILQARKIMGDPLSYNNYLDSEAAVLLLREFEKKPTAVLIKHNNPCGVASSGFMEEALKLAIKSDPKSAYGGVLAINQELTLEVAKEIDQLFLQVLIAPSLSSEAKDYLSKRKKLKMLIFDANQMEIGFELRSISGGVLIQEKDIFSLNINSLEVVTQKRPSEMEMRDLYFAFNVCRHVRSNAIVLVKQEQTIGIGAGQMSRVGFHSVFWAQKG